MRDPRNQNGEAGFIYKELQRSITSRAGGGFFALTASLRRATGILLLL